MRDQSWRISRPTSGLRSTLKNVDNGRGWFSQTEGTVTTPDGIVRVSSQNYERPSGVVVRSTFLDMVLAGRQYTRHWEGRMFSERYLITLAVRFARDVAQQAEARP